MSPTIWEIELYDGNTKIQINEDQQQPESSHLEYTVPDGSWKVMAFMCVKDGNNGMDYLDADSVRAFIDITYEEYYSRFQKYFENGTDVYKRQNSGNPQFCPFSSSKAFSDGIN